MTADAAAVLIACAVAGTLFQSAIILVTSLRLSEASGDDRTAAMLLVWVLLVLAAADLGGLLLAGLPLRFPAAAGGMAAGAALIEVPWLLRSTAARSPEPVAGRPAGDPAGADGSRSARDETPVFTRSHLRSLTAMSSRLTAGTASRLAAVRGAGAITALVTCGLVVVAGFAIQHQLGSGRPSAARASRPTRHLAVSGLSSRHAYGMPAPEAIRPPSAPPVSARPGQAALYLSGLTPAIDNQGAQAGPQTIAGAVYPDSISFTCDGGDRGAAPDEAYDVAGFRTFVAEAGIPDAAPHAPGAVAVVTFSDQSGQRIGWPVRISPGHPAAVRLDIAGVSQLGISCHGPLAHSGNPDAIPRISLGDAVVG
jgi:hypothetical protein